MLCSVTEHSSTKPFHSQTAQKNSASLCSSVWPFENSVMSYCSLQHAFLCFNCLLGWFLEVRNNRKKLTGFLRMTITIHFKFTLEETINSNKYAGMYAKSTQRFPPKCFSYDLK